jgi:hypothetical protein
MKTLLAMVVGTVALLPAGVAWAQNGTMMNGGGWMSDYGGMGGYGGLLVPILLVIAAAGLVMWLLKQKRK